MVYAGDGRGADGEQTAVAGMSVDERQQQSMQRVAHASLSEGKAEPASSWGTIRRRRWPLALSAAPSLGSQIDLAKGTLRLVALIASVGCGPLSSYLPPLSGCAQAGALNTPRHSGRTHRRTPNLVARRSCRPSLSIRLSSGMIDFAHWRMMFLRS